MGWVFFKYANYVTYLSNDDFLSKSPKPNNSFTDVQHNRT